MLLAAGIGCLRGRGRARILNIVLHGLVVAGTIVTVAQGDLDGAVVPLVWSGTALGLSIAGRPWA